MRKLLSLITLIVICGLLSWPVFVVDAALSLRQSFSVGDFGVVSNDGVDEVILSRVSSGEYAVGRDGLPVRILRLVIDAGSIDSVVAEVATETLFGEKLKLASDQIATFAGDDFRAAEFYSSGLRQLREQDRDLDSREVVRDRMLIGGKQVITLSVEPFRWEPQEARLFLSSQVDLQIFGSDDLEHSVISSEQYRELLSQVNRATESRRTVTKSGSSANGADYLIVTAGEFFDELMPLAMWKQAQGLTVAMFDIAAITAGYAGVDDAEKLRNFLIENYNAGTKYVLLGGDETVLPIRYAYHANASTMPDLQFQNICDLYFGDVNGNWDADGDGIYGEPYQDQPDLNAELLVGRLPFNQPGEFTAYGEKLIAYEKNPAGGDFDYLNRSLFISADQMRDYQGVGQQELLATAFPSTVTSDVNALVEAPTGDAANPAWPLAPDAIAQMSEGWGFMTLLIHGVYDGWVLRSNEYNLWPKSFLFTANGTDETHGFLPNLAANDKPGVVYSIGCDNAAFDMDSPPFNSSNPSVAEMFMTKPDGGAVAFVGYSRWGWVASSWRLEEAFIKYLFETKANPAEAVRHSKALYSYYRDLCYGLNYFGDPALRVWTSLPQASALEVMQPTDTGMVSIDLELVSGDAAIAGATITLTQNGNVILQTTTDGSGSASVEVDFSIHDEFVVTAYKAGFVGQSVTLSPGIVLDADDNEEQALPREFRLHQNTPNPFNPITSIGFELASSSRVVIEVVNILGQTVKRLIDEPRAAGDYGVTWDGSDDTQRAVASGVYFAVMRTEQSEHSIKMTLLK